MFLKGGGTAAFGNFTVLDLHKYINSDEKKKKGKTHKHIRALFYHN